jgi:hypothetical protein
LIADHLRQDGVPIGRHGLVDVGWRGRFASHVAAVLGPVVGEEPVHFHFGGDQVPADIDSTLDVHRFAFDDRYIQTKIARPISCVETLTGSGSPRVESYRRGCDGKVEMVFDDPGRGDRPYRKDLAAGAAAVAERMPSRAELDGRGLEPVSLDAETRAVLERWWNHPTRDEASLMAAATVDVDERGTAFRPVIVPYRWSDAGAVIQGRTIRGWPRGSVMASGSLISMLVRAAWVVRTAVRGRRNRRER